MIDECKLAINEEGKIIGIWNESKYKYISDELKMEELRNLAKRMEEKNLECSDE